jgi:glycine cleavage system H protein
MAKRCVKKYNYGREVERMTDNYPNDIKYSKTHEWVKFVDDSTAFIGITEHAQDSLGDVVYLELPDVGTKITVGTEFGVVESTKSASDLYAPISGEVLEINEEIVTTPSLLNTDPYEDGWIARIKISPTEKLSHLMSAKEYQDYLHAE